MLTEIRDRSSGWFAWIIAALIIIPMAFWGVQEYASTEAAPTLVKVGDQKITQNQFQTRLNTEQQRQRQLMGGQISNDLLTSDYFKDSVLQQMVNRALIDQVADEQNYRIGDQQLSTIIKENKIFQIDGQFNQDAYERYVVGSQYSKTQFENNVRSNSRVNQVMSGYQESALVLPDEVRTFLEIQAEQRSFDLLTVNKADYLKGVVVLDAEISDYYTGNEQQFLEPEKTSVSYLELDINQLLLEVEVDEEELLALYEQNTETYLSQEKRQTRHILLDKDNKALADELVIKLRAGGDFAELAKEHSNDPGSAVKGGDLGLVEHGQMVAEFEKATFELEQYAISEPIKSQFGYHIIQVQEIQTPEQQSFDDVRFDLEQEEKDRLAEELLLERVDQLRNLAFEQPDNLDSAAEELSLTLQKTELFEQATGTGLAATAAVREAAFSEDVLRDGVNSEPIQISDDRYVVLRMLEHKESKSKVLALVTEQIKTILTNQKALDAAKEAGDSLLEKAQLNWQSLVGDETLIIESHTLSLADSQRKVANEILQLVISLNLDGAAEAVDSVSDRNGDVHIVRLTNIASGDINTLSAQIKESTRRVVRQRNGQSLVTGYIKSLREKFSPEINSELL